MKRLLVATDLSARSDRAVERAVDLARRHAAELTVLHVVDEDLPLAAREAVAAAAEAAIAAHLAKLPRLGDIAPTVKIVVGNPFNEIVDMAADENCDLVLLGRHRNESGHAAFGGTTMARVARIGDRPVLVVTDRADGAYRKILVAVDLSPLSRHAMQAAIALSPDAEFHIVHAYDVPFEGFLPGRQTRRDVEREHERALARFVEDEIRRCAAAEVPKIETVMSHGEVSGVLRREAERLRPDLLAIGTHGRTGLAHAVLGSIAQNLLDRPPCDVLAVKAPPEA